MKIEKVFGKYSDLVEAYFTDRECGNVSFKWSGKDCVKNRKKVFNILGWDLNKLITVSQPHGRKTIQVDCFYAGRGAYDKNWINGYDGLVSNDLEVILGVEVADCLPIFAFDPVSKSIGVLHAGWRGVVAGATSSLLERMNDIGSINKNIHIYIGPHIKNCCFEVNNDIKKKFELWLDSMIQKKGKLLVDLSKIIATQLTKEGVLMQNIKITKDCTLCQKDRYFSYRREGSGCEGAMMAFIKLKK